MHAFTFTSTLLFAGAKLVAGLDSSSLTQFKDSLALTSSFGPVKEAYWTGYPHHRRTPFAVSPDGLSAYLAYLDSSGTDVHIQKVKVDTFAADGAAVTITGGKEAGGLVAHDDGFALLTNEALPSGTSNVPAGSTPVPVIYRYTSGAQTWKTFIAGPDVDASFGLLASPDMNGDLVYSEAAKMYGAYFVATAYTGDANGHFGDAIQYVTSAGARQNITGASSTWGCSHNTGILFEAADEAPFASVCAEDQGDIWLNTKTQSMSGVKISNENTTNGASGEPFGGMSGSYSGLARFQGADSYIMSWVSNGAVDLTANTWLGDGFTSCSRRNKNRNVAIATFSDKNTLFGAEASSTVGTADGDSQINWLTTGDSDMTNSHIATFDKSSALVTWEEISSPNCESFIAMGCYGTYAGTSFQIVDSTGAKSGTAFSTTDVQVAGDMVTMRDGRICWPFVSMTWSLAQMADTSAATKAISFACISNGASNGTSSVTSSASSSASTPLKSTTESTISSSSAAASANSSIAAVAAVVASSTVQSVASSTAPSISAGISSPSYPSIFSTGISAKAWSGFMPSGFTPGVFPSNFPPTGLFGTDFPAPTAFSTGENIVRAQEKSTKSKKSKSSKSKKTRTKSAILDYPTLTGTGGILPTAFPVPTGGFAFASGFGNARKGNVVRVDKASMKHRTRPHGTGVPSGGWPISQPTGGFPSAFGSGIKVGAINAHKTSSHHHPHGTGAPISLSHRPNFIEIEVAWNNEG